MIDPLKRITDKAKIEEILRFYLVEPAYQKRFLVEIYSDALPNGWIFEGARPLSICTEFSGTTKEAYVTLTNGDSKYSRPIGTIKLSTIRHLSELPEWEISRNKKTNDKVGTDNLYGNDWEG